ncbi:MAG: GlxA family transcriptional regulator [Gammaproteobacteria bacterium]
MTNLAFTPKKPLNRPEKVRKIVFVAYPGVNIIDITGPFDVFTYASHSLQRGGLTREQVYSIEIVSDVPGPVKTMSGLEINANRSYADIDYDIDTLVIPGGIVDISDTPGVAFESVLKNGALLHWINNQGSKVNRLASVCTGAFILAHCGLLDRRRVTTHWEYSSQLKNDYPSLQLEADKIFIRDGNVYTSGGITSGIDLALALLEEDWGQELALYIARWMVVFLKRPGGQSQFSAYLIGDSSARPCFQDLQAWIIEHPAENLHVDTLAERMAMSPRNFARTFLAETGITPAKFVELARIDAARHYLEREQLSIEEVAMRAGFMDPERMRRTFIRHLGVNPQSYRERFGPAYPISASPLYRPN